jgi:hypothetical protein
VWLSPPVMLLASAAHAQEKMAHLRNLRDNAVHCLRVPCGMRGATINHKGGSSPSAKKTFIKVIADPSIKELWPMLVFVEKRGRPLVAERAGRSDGKGSRTGALAWTPESLGPAFAPHRTDALPWPFAEHSTSGREAATRLAAKCKYLGHENNRSGWFI